MAEEPQPQPSESCGCIPVLVVVDMVYCAILGFRIGSHWGAMPAITGLVFGAVLGFPITGVLLLFLAGVAYVIELIAGQKESG